MSSDEDPTLGPEAGALDVTEVLGKPISLQQLTALVEGLSLPATPGARRFPIGR